MSPNHVHMVSTKYIQWVKKCKEDLNLRGKDTREIGKENRKEEVESKIWLRDIIYISKSFQNLKNSTLRCHLTPLRKTVIKKTITNYHCIIMSTKMQTKGNPIFSYCRNLYRGFYKTKNKSSIWSYCTLYLVPLDY